MGQMAEAYETLGDMRKFEAAGIFVGAPEKSPGSGCTQGKWHANDAAGENLDCGSADLIVGGNSPEGTYPGLVKSVHLVVREPVHTEALCQDPNCPSTNWGGSNRVHYRGSDCPPFTG